MYNASDNLSYFTDLPERISRIHSADAEYCYLQYSTKPGDNLEVKFTAFCEEENYYYACPGMYILIVLLACVYFLKLF